MDDKVFIFDGEMLLKLTMCRSSRIYLEMFTNISYCKINAMSSKYPEEQICYEVQIGVISVT